MAVHRINICIEVPAIPDMGKASLVGFEDMLRYVSALVEQGKEDAEGRVAGAPFNISYEWSVDPKLVVKTLDEKFEERHAPA